LAFALLAILAAASVRNDGIMAFGTQLAPAFARLVTAAAANDHRRSIPGLLTSSLASQPPPTLSSRMATFSVQRQRVLNSAVPLSFFPAEAFLCRHCDRLAS
jgi:hypothetical protein